MRIIILSIILIGFFSCSDSNERDKPNIDWANNVQYGTKTDKLIEHIPIKNNELYIYADYDHIEYSDLPIYLINTTDSTFNFGDTYFDDIDFNPDVIIILEEYENSKGDWIRSEIDNSGILGCFFRAKMDRVLRSNEYFKILKKIKSNGRKKRIRYSTFNSLLKLTSNVGVGYVDLDEVMYAKMDRTALMLDSTNYLIKIIKGKDVLFESGFRQDNFVEEAAFRLVEYYPKEAIEVLEPIAQDSSHIYHSLEMERLIYLLKNCNQ